MDHTSAQAARLLEAVAACHERLIALAISLRSRPLVSSVAENLTLCRYRTGPVLEGYVDAELTSGEAVAALLEVHWDEAGWVVESAITVNHARGQDSLRVFPERSATSLDGLIAALEQASDDLVSGFTDWDHILADVRSAAKQSPDEPAGPTPEAS